MTPMEAREILAREPSAEDRIRLMIFVDSLIAQIAHYRNALEWYASDENISYFQREAKEALTSIGAAGFPVGKTGDE